MELFSGGSNPLLSSFHLYTLILFISGVSIALTSIGVGIAGALVWALYADAAYDIKNMGIRAIWKKVPSALMILGLGDMVALVIILMMYADANVESAFGSKIDQLGGMVMKTNFRINVGANTSIPILSAAQEALDTLKGLFDAVIGNIHLDIRPAVYATYLRTNGVATYIEGDSDGQPLPPNEVVSLEKQSINMTRNMITAATVITLLITFDTKLGVVCLLLALSHVFLADKKDQTRFDSHTGMIASGVYRLEKRWLVWTLSRSIGVSFDGTMHGCYHATQLTNLIVGNRIFTVSYASVHADLVTWAGMPKMLLPKADEVCYVNRESEEKRSTRAVTIHLDAGLRGFTWLGETVPGESGSPVWVKRDDELVLAGLAGRWAKYGEETTEMSIAPGITSTSGGLDTNTRKILLHPGKGKTRVEIPRIVMEAASKNKKIMIVGPTRIVAMEIYRSLLQHFSSIGLSVKGYQSYRNPRAMIQVSTHTSFMRMILNKAYESNVDYLVIDEAHFNTVGTKMARKYGSYMAQMGKIVYELSATLDGQCARGSNFKIRDEKIQAKDQMNVVERLVAGGKRVLWFVAGMDGVQGATQLSNTLNDKGIKALPMGRSTFETNYRTINDETVRVVVTTNISECGLNIDCDAVVDCGSEFGMFDDGGFVNGQLVGISQASRVQRRGRVGRREVGEYYYVENNTIPLGKPVCETDAELLCAGREWNMSDEGDQCMSDEQAIYALEHDVSPRLVLLTRDSMARPLGKKDLRHQIAEWKQDGDTFAHCNKCQGKYNWFDMRHHDTLISLQEDGEERVDQNDWF